MQINWHQNPSKWWLDYREYLLIEEWSVRGISKPLSFVEVSGQSSNAGAVKFLQGLCVVKFGSLISLAINSIRVAEKLMILRMHLNVLPTSLLPSARYQVYLWQLLLLVIQVVFLSFRRSRCLWDFYAVPAVVLERLLSLLSFKALFKTNRTCSFRLLLNSPRLYYEFTISVLWF